MRDESRESWRQESGKHGVGVCAWRVCVCVCAVVARRQQRREWGRCMSWEGAGARDGKMPGKSNRPQAGHPVCRRRSTLGGRVCCTWSSTRARSVATLGASCPRRHARQRRAKSRSRLREERSVTRGHAASGGAWRLARELREQACEWTPAATHAHTRQGTADSLKTGLCDMSSNSQHSSPASSITCLRSHVRSARL